MINSRAKGKRIELQACDFLRSLGFTCRRGQQFAGGTDSPDVIVDELPDVHIEVKGDKSIRLGGAPWLAALRQAVMDAGDKQPVVLWWAGRGQCGSIGFRLSVWPTGATHVGPVAIRQALWEAQCQGNNSKTGDAQ